MRIQLNGEPTEIEAPSSVSSLLDGLGLDTGRIAVELNRRILPRREFSDVMIEEGDAVEIVTFVGGG